MEDLESKFSLFLSQFQNDQEINFLFQFLDIMVQQYKTNPEKVLGKKKTELVFNQF